MRKMRWKSLLAGMTTAALLTAACLPASAAELKAADFIDVFGTGSVVGTETDGKVPISWDGCGIGNRVTYMQPVVLDGLKVVLKDLNIGAKDPQDSGDGRGLWFTFAQEAGHYWGNGATGVHFRLNHDGDGLSLYVKKADDMSESEENIYFPAASIGLKGWPATMTMQFSKVDGNYEMDINGTVIKMPADKIDANLSPSGKCYFTFGIYKEKGGSGSLSVAEISNANAAEPTDPPAPPESSDPDGSQPGNPSSNPASTPTTKAPTTKAPTTTASGDADGTGGFNWVPVIIVAAVIVVLGGGAAAFILIKKKKSAS